jgi:hypothetical protein
MPGPSPSWPYSPECVEESFSELRTELGVCGIMIGVDRVREILSLEKPEEGDPYGCRSFDSPPCA